METILEIGVQNALMATVLACLVAGICRLVRRPALRHCLWLLVVLKLLTPPLWDWPVIWRPVNLETRREGNLEATRDAAATFVPLDSTQPPTAPTEPVTPHQRPTATEAMPPEPTDDAIMLAPKQRADAQDNEPAAGQGLNWRAVVLAFWLGGSLFVLGASARRVSRFRHLLRRTHQADGEVRERVTRLAGLLGIRRVPAVRMAPWAIVPTVSALGRTPTLVIPEPLWLRLNDQQRDTLLAHELAHLRRGDHWVRWLELVAFVLYFWHPVVWWARRRLRDAEEECCDAWVIATLPAARDAYAGALVETVTFLSERRGALPVLASGAGHVRFLERRLTVIMQGNPRARLSWLGVAGLFVLGAVLPLRPTFAQPAAPAAAHQAPPADPFARNTPVPFRDNIYWTGQYAAATESPQDLSDDVELLRVQLVAKQAETNEAKALLEQARRVAERLGRARASGAVPEEEVDQAKTELLVREARLQVKEAQAKEAALRLSQAERRLTGLRQRGAPSDDSRSAGSRPAGNVPAAAQGYPLAPSSTAPAARYPASTEPVKTPMYGPAMSRSAPAHGQEDRLAALEKKIDALTKELAALRQQLGPRSDPEKK